MHVDLERYRDTARSLRVRALLLLFPAAAMASVGITALVLCVLIALFPSTIEEGDLLYALGGVGTLGVLPTGIAIGLAIPGLRARRRLKRLRLLTALIRRDGELTAEDVEREMGLKPGLGADLLGDAATAGILGDRQQIRGSGSAEGRTSSLSPP